MLSFNTQQYIQQIAFNNFLQVKSSLLRNNWIAEKKYYNDDNIAMPINQSIVEKKLTNIIIDLRIRCDLRATKRR